jgi:hypothetical protein
MSLIPQRKKTPEELAALRAQEFSQASPPPAAAPPEPQPEPQLAPTHYTPPQKHGVFHDVTGHTLSGPSHAELAHDTHLPEPAPQRLSRRGPPEKHGTVHAFEGLRPEAAMEMPQGQRGTVAPLPQRKHDGSEIQQLRHRGLMQTRPPVQSIVQMSINPVLAGILYIIAFAVIYLTVRYWSQEGTQRFYSPGIGCGLLLLVSLFLYLKKPRARHHAAFLCGIACVVLGFVILLTLKNPYAP